MSTLKKKNWVKKSLYFKHESGYESIIAPKPMNKFFFFFWKPMSKTWVGFGLDIEQNFQYK